MGSQHSPETALIAQSLLDLRRLKIEEHAWRKWVI